MATSLKSFVSKICFPNLFHKLFPKSDFDLFLDVFWMVFGGREGEKEGKREREK